LCLNYNRNYCDNRGYSSYRINNDNQRGFDKTREVVLLALLFCHQFSALTGQWARAVLSGEGKKGQTGYRVQGAVEGREGVEETESRREDRGPGERGLKRVKGQ
jgi:hypothetical protein